VEHASEQLDDRVREALYCRGVADDQIALMRLGYLNKTLPDLPYPKAFLDWSHNGNKLDDVIMLPLTNTLNEVRGVQFRHVERERAGYMDYFEERGEAVLFGLGQAMPHIWKSRRIFLVEGGFDLFPIQRHIPETVATLTARVVDPLIRVLRRLVKDVWLGYDNDKTGMDARIRFEVGYGKEFKLHDFRWPKESMADNKLTKDPADLWETWGEDRFRKFLRGSPSTVEMFT
jgi:DNA primase